MIVELHILQNFAPSNLNRDDTGSPKDCEFGGYRRARISSQSFKRAIRTKFREDGLIDARYLAMRTKRAADAIARRLVAKGKAEEAAQQVVAALLTGAKLEVGADGKTKYLLFLAADELDAAADICLQHWDALTAAVAAQAGTKTKNGSAIPVDIVNALQKRLDGGRAADLALFGRMIADLPEKNGDGATQVAHAISTNRMNMEFDFYTAVDDLRPEDTAGADMLGTVEFNSACFYRYANVDTDQLLANLRQDSDLAHRTLAAFLQAMVTAVPTGKQNSMAAHNPPSLVLSVVRERGQWNLANAFVKPVWPHQDMDLVAASVSALDTYWEKLATMYGTDGIRGMWVATTEPEQLKTLVGSRVPSVAEIVTQTLKVAALAPAYVSA